MDSLERVRRLASTMAGGKGYERWADVEEQIKSFLPLPQSVLLSKLKDFQNETLVFFIKEFRRGSEAFIGPLVQELSDRTIRMATRLVRDLDRITREHIVIAVEFEILKVVLDDTPSSTANYVEVAFAKKVEQLVINAVRRSKRSPLGQLRGEYVPFTDDQDSELGRIQRPLELLPEHGPGPEASLLQKEEATARAGQLQQVREIVKNPKDWEILTHHLGEGMPITSSDRSKETVSKRVRKRPQRIRYRLQRAKKAILAALKRGSKHD
jgi:hypothetical protein